MHLEPLFYDYGVDLAVWAHDHEYQRIFPLYNYTLCKGSESEPYKNPRAPVHVISGSAVSICNLIFSSCSQCVGSIWFTQPMRANASANFCILEMEST